MPAPSSLGGQQFLKRQTTDAGSGGATSWPVQSVPYASANAAAGRAIVAKPELVTKKVLIRPSISWAGAPSSKLQTFTRKV
jgi:hypothetical protein